MSDKATYNPFGNADGTPKKGKEAEFFRYVQDHDAENRNDIPESDAEIIRDTEEAQGESSMDSDPESAK